MCQYVGSCAGADLRVCVCACVRVRGCVRACVYMCVCVCASECVSSLMLWYVSEVFSNTLLCVCGFINANYVKDVSVIPFMIH